MAKWSQDSKLGDLLNDPAPRAVIDKFVPGLSTDPQAKLGYGFTFKMVCSFAQTGVSKEKLAEIDTALQALG